MPAFKPVYLVHGDDHGRVAERRGRLRVLAEAESGAAGVEVLAGDAATPEGAAAALNAMTFATGRRFIVVDGVERWKDAEVEAALVPTIAAMPPDTTIAFFASEEGRLQAPQSLVRAVEAAGGSVTAERLRKARDLPRWAVDEAARMGVRLDGAAAQALIAQVGDRQQRLLRELEKLALEHGSGSTIDVDVVESAAALSAERQVWALADAVAARDRQAALAAYGSLRQQGEDPARLAPVVSRRLRELATIAERIEAGASSAEIKRSARMSPYAADRRIREAQGADLGALRLAVERFAELEVATRGGSELAPDTLVTRALLAVT